MIYSHNKQIINLAMFSPNSRQYPSSRYVCMFTPSLLHFKRCCAQFIPNQHQNGPNSIQSQFPDQNNKNNNNYPRFSFLFRFQQFLSPQLLPRLLLHLYSRRQWCNSYRVSFYVQAVVRKTYTVKIQSLKMSTYVYSFVFISS